MDVSFVQAYKKAAQSRATSHGSPNASNASDDPERIEQEETEVEIEDIEEIDELPDEPITTPIPIAALISSWIANIRRSRRHDMGHGYTIVGWNERYGAYTRFQGEPCVLYTDGIDLFKKGRTPLYQAREGVDACILCPVQGCRRVFTQLSLVERHIDNREAGGEPEHTKYAQSAEFLDIRHYPRQPIPAPCQHCKIVLESGRVDTMKRHEKACEKRDEEGRAKAKERLYKFYMGFRA